MRKILVATLLLACCAKPRPVQPPAARPSILLVTLDTTRADAIGPEQKNAETPAFNALAARGRRFRYAYATAPQTLPSHASMMTGLYPGGHGVHENGRYLPERVMPIAQQLKNAGYRTAAFVSAFAVARRFGLARGFEVYDDDFGKDRVERGAAETTDRAVAHLATADQRPLFLWVHYYDPHFPYEPPEPFRSRYTSNPYLGEVASMDQQLARLTDAFERLAQGPRAIVVVADHGEGLGDHGETQHGNLLYQSTMHVPLVLIGPGVAAGVDAAPVSTRRVFHTIADWAALGSAHSLRSSAREVVLGEAMKPFLDYGWRPQVMAVDGTRKAILAGKLELYDVLSDPRETRDLSARADLSREVRAALRDYPLPDPKAQAAAAQDDESRRQLAALGYISATVKPVMRADAPRPADMVRLFELLDTAAALFVRGLYAESIPLLQRILEQDPHNLDAALRLASAHSSLGHELEAIAAFRRAEAIAPDSQDVRTYLALHYARGKEWQKAIPLLERIVAESPDRLPPLEALTVVRERQRRIEDAVALRRRVYALRSASPAELLRLGEMEMALGRTAAAIEAFERARSEQRDAFQHNLELGVLYLAERRFPEAREALDRVPPNHPAYPMALFKRAQVSVLLREPDASRRIAAARVHADSTTRPLIERERLFR